MKLEHFRWIVAALFIVYTPIFSANDERKTVIESFHVQSDIRYRFATTQMVSLVRNKDVAAREINFDVTLPEEAFISHFSMLIDNITYNGTVKGKSQAQKEYNEEVSRGQSAALVKDQFLRNPNTFSVSVNVKAGTAVTFTLIYQELLRRKNGVYEHEIHAKPGQAVEDFLIEIYILEKEKITVVNKPVFKTDSLLNSIVEVGGDLIVVDRPTPESAHIVYRPSQDEQGDKGISAQFTVQYDVEHKPGGEILVVDGYFIHFFAPSLPPIPKDIIIVIDVSGSMYGSKLDQVKEAMIVILNDLQPLDRFNIIRFNEHVTKWKTELVSVEEKTIQEAKQFVQNLKAEGLTNLNDALVMAVRDFNLVTSRSRASMIFFLTDGEPTHSEKNPDKITANVARENELKVSIYGLAFGARADYQLLKKVSLQNFGFARKIYEASDAALQVTGLYKELSAVSLLDASITYLSGGVEKSSLTKSLFPLIFSGSEVAVSGKLANSSNTLEILIEGVHPSGNFSFIVPAYEYNNNIQTENPFFTLPKDYSDIVERMWAYLTVKQLLKDKEGNLEENKKLLESRIIEISIKYNFVTPLTAMIVKKPEKTYETVPTVQIPDPVAVEDGNVRQGITLAPYLDLPSLGFGDNRGTRVKSYRYKDPYFSSSDGDFDHGSATQDLYQSQSQYKPRYVPLRSSQHVGVADKFNDPFPEDLDDFFKKMPEPVYPTTFPDSFRATHKKQHLRRKEKSRRRHQRKKTTVVRKTFTGNLLPVFTVVSGSQSLCVLPKRIQLGTYRLLKAQNSTTFDLGFVCNKKTCPAMPMGNPIIGANHVAIYLVNKDVLGWKFAAGSAYSVNTTEDELNISGQGINLKVNWKSQGVQSKLYKFYTLEMTLDPSQKYTGLVGDLLNVSGKRLKKMGQNIPSVCKGYKLSKSIKAKTARKYLISE